MRIWYTNEELADVLDRVADLLQVQRRNRGRSDTYRALAFRRAASSIRSLPRPVVAVLDDEGLGGIERIFAVGNTIAASLRELIETGKLRYLERLEGAVSPEDLFMTIPGIGEALAGRRVVRGRESECRDYYAHEERDSDVPWLPGFEPGAEERPMTRQENS